MEIAAIILAFGLSVGLAVAGGGIAEYFKAKGKALLITAQRDISRCKNE